ncbi:DUF4145 domain-containing protein [Burkholderia ubonensis]|uniref:DUF4145 domain-containing protein n=1 Tax=Burkholderia ubonensis TaxID=101571 RepID=UPI0009B4D3C4|nr:DUF4145 domain-containing protein [Burkholderia ubonensis]
MTNNGEKQERSITLDCHSCLRPTEHKVLRKFHDEWDWTDDEYPYHSVSGVDDFFIVRCGGCDKFAFIKRSWFSENDPDQGPTIVRYPPVPVRSKPVWANQADKIPTTVLNLLEDVYRSIQVDADTVAAMGVRAIFEHVMVQTVGDHGRFEANVDEFVAAGYIGTRYKSLVLRVLDVGHAAIHRGHEVSRSELLVMLGLLESVVELVYVHPDAIEALPPTPPRPPRQKKVKKKTDAEKPDSSDSE